MKKIVAILITVGIIFLAFKFGAAFFALAKIFIGLIMGGLFIAGIVVGRLLPKRK